MGISFYNTYRSARRLVKTGKRAIMVLQCLHLDKIEYVNGGFPYFFEKQKDPNFRWDLFASLHHPPAIHP